MTATWRAYTTTHRQRALSSDSFFDRVAEGLVFGGIAYYGAGGLLTWMSIAAIVASVSVSYARARGEALGIELKVGFMQRSERMAITITLVCFSGALPLIWPTITPTHVLLTCTGIVAVGASITATRRVWLAYQLLSKPAAVTTGAPASLPEPAPMPTTSARAPIIDDASLATS